MRYYDALKTDTAIEWPVMDRDFVPYWMDHSVAWSGYYTSRANAKKQIKDFSNLFHAQASIFARRVIDQSCSEADIGEILAQNYKTQDELALYQHHDGISGTESQYVEMDYNTNLVQAFKNSESPYKKYILQALHDETGINVKDGVAGLQMCTDLSQNDTVKDCPVSEFKDKSEVIVVVHNPHTQSQNSLLRILLPSSKYTAQLWSREEHAFKEVESDVIEQQHFDRSNSAGTVDYLMFVNAGMLPADQLIYLKLVRTQ